MLRERERMHPIHVTGMYVGYAIAVWNYDEIEGEKSLERDRK